MILYIPRVFREHADVGYIASVFEQRGIGWVHHVDLVAKHRDGQHFYQAFVHFVYWYNTWDAHTLQAQVVDPQVQARLYLSLGAQPPVFWIVQECRNPTTPVERELRNQLQDERAQHDWEIEQLRKQLAEQDALLERLFDAYPDDTIDSFDPLLNTPNDASELPITGAELAATQTDEMLRDFYEESPVELFSPRWVAMTDDEKRARLDAELLEYMLGT